MKEIDPAEGGFLIRYIETELGAEVIGRLGGTIHRVLQKDDAQGIAVLLPSSVYSKATSRIEISLDDFRHYEALEREHACSVYLFFVDPGGKPRYHNLSDLVTNLADDAIARFQAESET